MLKSLIVSQLLHILSLLQTNYAALDKLNNMFYSFLWSGKGDNIKREVMISDYKNGVLRMIDIKCFNKALKSSWVKKYLDHENYGKWKLFSITNCRNSAGLTSLRVTLIKAIWQNSLTYLTPSQQKF